MNPLLRTALWTTPREFRREYGESIRRDVASRRLNLFASSFDVLCQGLAMRVEAVVRDLAWGGRQCVRAPLFTAVVIATFAVTIGANAAVFSVLRGVVLAPLPYPDSQRLVALEMVYRSNGSSDSSWSLPDIRDVDNENRSFSGVAAETPDSGTLTGHGVPRLLHGAFVTVSFFDVFGVHPQLGRYFVPADARAGAGNPIIVSDALWHSALGGRPNLLGTILKIGGIRFTVVGVAPRSLLNPVRPSGDSVPRPDYWLAVQPNGNQNDYSRGDRIMRAFARLRPRRDASRC